tara:strand:- start:2029 stop:2574 length:546 start_codon:yes stop_codon:yes gene_type:complete
MSRIEPIDPTQADPAVGHTLGEVKVNLGVLPNLFTTLARSPAALNSFVGFSDAVSGGRLSSRQRELIALAVAQRNQCGYCLSAHTAISKGLGITDAAVALARQGSAASPTDDAIVRFALAVVETRGAVSDDRLDAIRKAAGDDGIAIEIVANVALNTLTNYVSRLADTEVDFPLVSLAAAS